MKLYPNNTTLQSPSVVKMSKLINVDYYKKKNESIFSYLSIMPETTITNKAIQLKSNYGKSFSLLKIGETKNYSPNKPKKTSNLLNFKQSGKELKLQLSNTRTRQEEFSLLPDSDTSSNVLRKIKEIRGISESENFVFGNNNLPGKETSLKDKLLRKMNYLTPKSGDIFTKSNSKEDFVSAYSKYRGINSKLEIQSIFPEEKLNRISLSIKEINDEKFNSLSLHYIKELQHLVSIMDTKLKLVIKRPFN